MGAVFKLPVIHVENLADALARLQLRFQTRVVAADAHGASTIYDVPLTGNVCIVLGNEDAGISAAVAAVGQACAVIPMRKQTDSLNVGSASAVFL
jgi:23S rRNA (guanosine2251-2'-O)-methyltransferase